MTMDANGVQADQMGRSLLRTGAVEYSRKAARVSWKNRKEAEEIRHRVLPLRYSAFSEREAN